ncbi:MAG: nucleotide exchange factor GrpE [Candidatus Saccharimonadales bacterium]
MPKKSQTTSLKELKDQIEELTEALKRERADAMNVRRRTEDERAKLGHFYKAMVVNELLPALDNLERALNHSPKELANHDYVKGVQGVSKQFEQCLARLGVERIKAVGEQFDPKFHEAVSMEDKGGNVEVVAEELQPGYKIGDEIIRHATVKVKRQ